MNRALTALSFSLGLLVSSAAMAEHAYGPQYGGQGYDNGPQLDYAEVVSVDPIIEMVQDSVPREVCWNERVTVPQYSGRRDNAGASVLGAIIGGALGNTAGHGRGRRAATIAGAVIGGAIGNSSVRNNDRYYNDGPYGHNNGYRSRNERQCRVENDYVEREQVVGYNVTYRYNGQIFQTQTAAHPGNRIRVEVQVRPIG